MDIEVHGQRYEVCRILHYPKLLSGGTSDSEVIFKGPCGINYSLRSEQVEVAKLPD